MNENLTECLLAPTVASVLKLNGYRAVSRRIIGNVKNRVRGQLVIKPGYGSAVGWMELRDLDDSILQGLQSAKL
jgi:hypothetical protein